jgi:hypothetical protein
MKLSLFLTLFLLAGCAKHPVDAFYCGKVSKTCYDKSQLPGLDKVPSTDYVMSPTAYCFGGYIDTTEEVRFQPFKICYATLAECKAGIYDHSWVSGTRSPCDLTLPAQGGSGFDLKEDQQKYHM